MLTIEFAETVNKIKAIKIRQLELQQEEHRLYNELLEQLDQIFMEQLRGKVTT